MEVIESKDFVKDLSRIFNSELGTRSKCDLVARKVCDILSASQVTILLYSSREDLLISTGGYLSPNRSKLRTSDNKLRFILEHIGAFDFLRTKEHHLGKTRPSKLYKDYEGSIAQTSSISKEEFYSLCERFGDLYDRYMEYKKIGQGEKYAIDNTTITGQYFSLLKTPTNLNTTEIKNLGNFPETQKQCSQILRSRLGLIVDDNGFYIGLPLYATDRHFGVLRIIYADRPAFLAGDEGAFRMKHEYEQLLEYFSQLISLHLETSYYLDGYKQLSRLNETITEQTPTALNTTCEILSDVVNCNGALIRIYDPKTRKPEIKGFTMTLKAYVDFLKTYRDPKIRHNDEFSNSLKELFKKDATILGATFDNQNTFPKKLRIFKVDHENNIAESGTSIVLEDLRSEIYQQKLEELNIQQLTVVPIPNIEESFMILTNTRNREFIKADVEMLILAARGVGLEIKHIQDTETIKEQERLVAETKGMRDVAHQIGAPLTGIQQHISNIVNRRISDEKIAYNLSQINQMIRHSTRQLKRFQMILDLDIQPIAPKTRSFNLPRFLIGRSRDFQGLSHSKGLAIHVFDESENSMVYVNTDEDLLNEVVNNLIDNAVKYSFNSLQLIAHGISFDEDDFESDGNIQIGYTADHRKIKIKVSSWGAKINENEKALIFERGERGDNAGKFSPIGSGIGLYLVKKILEAMNASIKVSTDKSKTTFTVIMENQRYEG